MKKYKVELNNQLMDATIVNRNDNDFFNVEIETPLGTIWIAESMLVEVKEIEFKSNVNINIPKKYIHMIKEIDFEGREDGYWCYLHDGYRAEYGYGSQTLHEYTKADLLKAIRQCVEVTGE